MGRPSHRARARGSGVAAISARALVLWRTIRYSYWFLPTLMAIGAVFLVFAMGWADRRFDAPGWLAVEDAANVRSLLSTIAGSMITVAGVTFSIVIVALSLASSQFGPRLLVNFMRDTGNQVVLGTYVSTFVYCLLVLRRVEGGGENPYIPQWSAAAAVILALASLGVLIYFFHHVSMSIQAGHLVAMAGRRLDKAIRSTFPEPAGDDPPGDHLEGDDPGGDDQDGPAEAGGATSWPDDFERGAGEVRSEAGGYLDIVDIDALVELAAERDLYIALVPKPGDFFVRGGVLARIYPRRALDDEIAAHVEEACITADQRGDAETLALAIDRLTEVAVRALSPGINDPYTALACIDRLSAALALAAERDPPEDRCRDDGGTPRLRLANHDLVGLLERAIGRTRHYGRADLDLLLRLLDLLATVADAAERTKRPRDPALTHALIRHAGMIRDTAENALEHEWERQQARQRHDEVVAQLVFVT